METFNRPDASTESCISSSVLHTLPTPLLALIASNLPLTSLLHLQRCSSALHRLRADESYMSVAWHWSELKLSNSRTSLHEWTLPDSQCINDRVDRTLIPASVWQAAVPVFRAVIDDTEYSHDERALLRRLLQQPLPTQWIWAKRDGDGAWQSVNIDDETVEDSADVRRVEVLRDVDWGHLDEEVMPPRAGALDVRCQFVLRACPYLQHLDLTIRLPCHADALALVSHLRSLRVEQRSVAFTETRLFDISAMLDSLSHLTSLHCTNLTVDVTDLLAIGCHSTLEEMWISSEKLGDCLWIGFSLTFPVTVEKDEGQLRRAFDAEVYLTGDIEAESEQADTARADTRQEENTEGENERSEMQRMRAALTRTQPTQRSCEVRLALADWLHRRLRRGKLITDGDVKHPRYSKSQLRHRRRQVALLRSTLQSQLSELDAATVLLSGPHR